MGYSNPKIPEGINVTDEHPLKDFFLMLVGIGLAVIALITLLAFLAEYLVRFIPFEVEQHLAEQLKSELFVEQSVSEQHQYYLQELADRLAMAQQLPENMSVTVHYLEGEEVNAFATLGGHVFVFQGLLDRMNSENALSMVLAHEIAHIKHRDPIVAAGRGIAVSVALLCLVGAGDSAVADTIVSQIGLLTTQAFSRDMEQEADDEALQTLARFYGHTAGADDIFSLFPQEQKGVTPPALFRTHPLNQERISKVAAFQKRSFSGPEPELIPLPEWLTESGR